MGILNVAQALKPDPAEGYRMPHYLVFSAGFMGLKHRGMPWRHAISPGAEVIQLHTEGSLTIPTLGINRVYLRECKKVLKYWGRIGGVMPVNCVPNT